MVFHSAVHMYPVVHTTCLSTHACTFYCVYDIYMYIYGNCVLLNAHLLITRKTYTVLRAV